MKLKNNTENIAQYCENASSVSFYSYFFVLKNILALQSMCPILLTKISCYQLILDSGAGHLLFIAACPLSLQFSLLY